MSEQEISEARVKLSEMVQEGHASFNEGRTDEAMAIAQSVLMSDPNSTAALWLSAMCFERKGEIGAALECADKIVELNPDSELDKIRRNQLRTKLSAALVLTEKPDRRVAMVGAVAAGVLVLCMGALIANLTRGNAAESQQATTEVAVDSGYLASNQGVNTFGNPSVQATAPDPNQQSAQQTVLNPGDVGPVRQTTPVMNQPVLPPARETLPPVMGDIGSQSIGATQLGNLEVSPVRPPFDGSNTAPSQAQRDPDPAPLTMQEERQSTGYVDIRIHGENTRNASSGASELNANGVQSLVRAGNQQFQMGNYRQAADMFEKAVKAGADPITLNQRLGQAYERLGRSGDAVEAYRRSVKAAEAAINSGSGNQSQARAALDSSQQALRNLGG
jgi:tetratricopeptide (TPR) repeat protein